ncbi:protease inhibitor I42 family protein [Actinotalea sp.]|uniref:protease inhibitor I42 family protein n=1 Tax=Actinotalea sp. TaxID=1872145 RepID=UPI003563473B
MTVVIDEAGTVEATVGQEVILRLPEDPGTGYRWRISVIDGLALVDESFLPPDRVMLGAAGHRAFTVRATRPGTARLSVERRRVWERGAAETRDVVVLVRPAD